MKNTILKIAGVKNPEDFYKKHATEADFLKAYPKFALGGKMNIKAIQKFAGGGFFQDAGEGIGNYFKAVADTTLGTFGASNVIKDEDYSGYGANEMSNLNTTLQPMTSAILPMASNIALPGSGAIVSAGQQAIGTMNPEDNTGLDENGNPKNPDAAKYQQAGQTVAQLGGIGAQIYGASKSPSTGGGIPNGGPIKRAMGGMQQYAMGGMNVQPNAEAENDELVTTNTPPQVVSGGEVNMVSNNPYGTPDYAINGNNHGEGENGGGVKMNVASGSVFKGKLKNPLTGNLFKKDFKKISFQENMFTKKLENGDAYAKNTANLILPVLAKTKEDMEMYQQAILDNKKQAKDLRAGIMPMAMHGGMMNYMAMGGIQESDYQTDPAKLPSLLRQQKANDATILGMRSSFGRNADTNNVEDLLVVTFNKAKNYGKELADKIKNHPDNKKIEPFAMGGKLPMYQDGSIVPVSQSNNYFNNPSLNNESLNQYKFQQFLNNKENGFSAPQSTFNPHSVESWKFQQQLDKNGAVVPKPQQQPFYGYSDNYNPNVEDQDQMFNYDQDGNLDLNNYNIGNLGRSFPDHEYNNNPNYKFPHNEMNRYLNDANMANLNLQRKSQNTQSSFDPYTPAQNWNPKAVVPFDPNAGSRSGNTDTKVDTKVDPKDKGKGFDYKKAAGNLGQFALQNAGNIYDLGRSTQDNSKLNLSRVSPTFLDKTQDLQNNLRLYSEGKRQTAEASQGNASTYLSNMYANRASKLANDLNINTTYGNLNASIDNAAKLYNAGAIDKETMFKLQAEGMNRNLKGQALAGMSQNFLNQRNSDRQDALDQQRLGLQKEYYKEYWANQNRENQRKVDEITKGKSNKNSWLDCSSGNCVERTSDQTQSTQSTPSYFNQNQDRWNALAKFQDAQKKMGY